jgi:hypothetical protein
VIARDIIVSAYKKLNRLSPGETLPADDLAFGLDTLNDLIDELSAQNQFLYRSTITSNAQSGHITLGTGVWAAINVGDQIVSGTADNIEMAPITVAQYNVIYNQLTTARPSVFANDGSSTVYLWPVPTGHVIKLQTRNTVTAFADLTTDYGAPDGWKAAISAGLAVRLATPILGKVPQDLARAESKAMGAVKNYEPAILNVETFNKPRGYFPPRLF